MRDAGLEPFAPFPRTLFGGLPVVLVTRKRRYFPDPLPDGQFQNPCIPMRFHTRPSQERREPHRQGAWRPPGDPRLKGVHNLATLADMR